jgi:hypothetical protein
MKVFLHVVMIGMAMDRLGRVTGESGGLRALRAPAAENVSLGMTT